jgi:ABC-2 type transport system permease protein
MRVVWLMIRKDLLRKLRSPLGLAVTLAFPVVFAALLALAFGGGEEMPRVHLLVENRDEGFLGNFLMSGLGSDEVAKYFDVDVVGDEGEARIGEGDGSALLRVPETFTEDLVDGTPTRLELIRNPAQGIFPEIAEQVAGVLVEILSSGSRALRGPLDTLAPLIDSDDGPSDATIAEVSVAINQAVRGAERFLFPPVIDLDVVDLEEQDAEASGEGDSSGSSSPVFSVFLFVFPGVSVWSLFMAGDIAMRDILVEYEDGTLRRQLHGPIGAGTLIVAKGGFTAVVCAIGLVILTVIGAIARDRPVDPIGYVVLSLALVVAITGAGAAIYGAAGRQGRGSTIASVVYLALAFAGGSFLQLDAMPAAVQAIAPVSPFYWGTVGYKALLAGGGVSDVLGAVLVLAGLGVVLAATGAVLLRRRIESGAPS